MSMVDSQMTDSSPEEISHRMECEECGDMFDMRSLTEVAIHMHDGFVPEGDIVGERHV